jgi:POT family proton-dependent oligopeptide transporter
MAGLQTDDAAFAGLHEAKQDEYEAKKEGFHSDSSEYVDGDSLHDGIHDGLIIATEEDKLTLRHVPDAIPWNAYRAYLILLFADLTHG